MPFLSIFRKDKEPLSPTNSSFSRARSRPSIASRETCSPPPQLADLSPQSDLSYVLPELEELRSIIHPTSPPEPETIKKRGILTRRRESALASTTPNPRHTSTSPPRPFSEALIDRAAPRTPTNNNTNLRLDSDDEPLVPPPPRSSVFAGFSYSDHPRASSAPADAERPRPPRPQAHPHQRLRDDMKGKVKKDGSSGRSGLFGWRTKSSKETTINTTPDPDSSFSLKSFRHVGPPSPVVGASNSTTSLPVGGTPSSTFSRSTSTGSPVVTGNGSPTTTTTTGASSSSTARPIPGRSTPTARERVNSTSSEGMMAAGLFRQAARRSSTNLVEEAAEPIRSRMRDLEKRGPPTRSWAEDSTISSGSDRAAGPRKSAPDTSSRKTTVDNKPRKSTTDIRQSLDDDDSPPSPSPFAGRLGENGRISPFATRSESGHVPRVDYSMYGARSDGGIRSGSKLASAVNTSRSRPTSPTKPALVSSVFTTSPAAMPVSLPNTRPGPQGYTGPRSPTKPRPSSPEKRTTPSSPTKPRLSAPAATRPTRSPIRTTIPTKTNDGPSIKRGGTQGHKRQGSGSSQSSARASMSNLGHGRRPSIGAASARSVSMDVLSHTRQSSTDNLSSTRQPAADPVQSRRPSVDVLTHTRRPSGFEVISRPKSPGPASAIEAPRPSHAKTTDQLRQEAVEAMRNGGMPVSRNGSSGSGSTSMERAKSPAPSVASRMTTNTATRPPTDTQATPRKNYVPPPRGSSLAVNLVDSDSDESPEEVESESEGLGFGKRAGVGAMRGRHTKDANPLSAIKETRPSMANSSAHSRSNSDDQPGLTRERTITQRDAPPKVGVSLFDRPVQSRTRASHSTSAISAAATARNAATLAEANRASPPNRANANANVTVTRPGKKHNRGASFGAGSVRPAVGTDTDEDESESEESSEDDAPLSSLAPARRPGSAASTAASVRPGPGPRPSAPLPQTRATAPLISIPGVNAPPPRPPRINRVPGVGVTRNSSLRGSRSVEDLGRKPVVPRPGPRPFGASPPSSTGDSSSGKAPLTPRDGSEAGRGPSDEARRKERRRSEAKKSVELGNVINGPGPIPDDDDEENLSMGHSQMGHTMGMMGMGMGWNQSGFFPPGGAAFGGAPGFPTSQSMPFLQPQMTGQPMPMGFMPPPPPPGANDAYLQAHQQAMMIAKQTYLAAVAQQAMVAATEQWERSSNMGGSVYGGSQMSSNMGMMGMPMMSMYAGSSYAASAYEGSVAGWGSASAYGGPSSRSVYGGGGARSEFGGGMRTKPSAGTAQNRARGKTQTAGSDAQQRRDPVPPSTWATRRKAGL